MSGEDGQGHQGPGSSAVRIVCTVAAVPPLFLTMPVSWEGHAGSTGDHPQIGHFTCSRERTDDVLPTGNPRDPRPAVTHKSGLPSETCQIRSQGYSGPRGGGAAR